jgi:hypothetical protein
VLTKKFMSDENHHNGAVTAPLILTVPACGFVVALSLEWINGVALARIFDNASAQENQSRPGIEPSAG